MPKRARKADARPQGSPVESPGSVVVQHIRLTWTKLSRGVPGSRVRNAVPRALPLDPTDGRFNFQSHAFDERGATFSHRRLETIVSNEVPAKLGFLALRAGPGSGFEVGLVWTSGAGAPPRRTRPAALTIARGQSARLIINGRHASYSGQWYTQDTYNVAVIETPGPTLFTASAPELVYSAEADLF